MSLETNKIEKKDLRHFVSFFGLLRTHVKTCHDTVVTLEGFYEYVSERTARRSRA